MSKNLKKLGYFVATLISFLILSMALNQRDLASPVNDNVYRGAIN